MLDKNMVGVDQAPELTVSKCTFFLIILPFCGKQQSGNFSDDLRFAVLAFQLTVVHRVILVMV